MSSLGSLSWNGVNEVNVHSSINHHRKLAIPHTLVAFNFDWNCSLSCHLQLLQTHIWNSSISPNSFIYFSIDRFPSLSSSLLLPLFSLYIFYTSSSGHPRIPPPPQTLAATSSFLIYFSFSFCTNLSISIVALLSSPFITIQNSLPHHMTAIT